MIERASLSQEKLRTSGASCINTFEIFQNMCTKESSSEIAILSTSEEARFTTCSSPFSFLSEILELERIASDIPDT